MPIYVKLFHGRKDPNQDMEDWGERGPVFECDWFHTTYLHHIRMGNAENDDMELKLVGDMLYYDGMYYGDWSAFAQELISRDLLPLLQKYDPAKATPPEQPKADSVVLTLKRDDAGQILDGIRERKASWENTLAYHRGEDIPSDLMLSVEDCKDADEAEKIVAHYAAIVEQLEAQL